MAKHEMVSLKRTAEESKKDGDFPESPSKDFFPLSLFLNGPEIKKLGLSKFQVGEEHELVAKVKVTSVSVSENSGSKKRESITLTLIEGEVNSAHGKSSEDQAKILFDKK